MEPFLSKSVSTDCFQLLDNGITTTSTMLCDDVAFKVICAQMNTKSAPKLITQNWIKAKKNLSNLQQDNEDLKIRNKLTHLYTVY